MFAPADARPRARVLPMPPLPPVMIATLPSSQRDYSYFTFIGRNLLIPFPECGYMFSHFIIAGRIRAIWGNTVNKTTKNTEA